MARQMPAQGLHAIENAVHLHAGDASAVQIAEALPVPIAARTLQYRLKHLVDQGRLLKIGNGRWARYRLEGDGADDDSAHACESFSIPLSTKAEAVRDHVRQPLAARKPIGYDRRFLERYRPNASFYLSRQERARLAALGGQPGPVLPAGTYVRHILGRLLIDLSWNSSRLEGNTYSMLDTRRLIELGEEAPGHATVEAQMILNHKDAIEFLVENVEEAGFNRYTILNLHALLANNLLPDPAAEGRLRYIAVGIERSVFVPLAVPQLIQEHFDHLLATAEAIEDPFEQAFFAMVQLPYLQAFDDANKRVSRLAANIPLIKANLAPLSFIDVPRQIYAEANLGVYECNDVALLKDVFLWAYERSAARYAAVRQSLGEPDQFRLRYRALLGELVGMLVREAAPRKGLSARIAAWSTAHIPAADRARFASIAEAEVAALHEGNFARYRIRPTEFAAWRSTWKKDS